MEQETKKEPTTFDYLDSINQNKKDLMTPDNEKEYQWFLVNHFLGSMVDTIFYANEMNQRHHLDKRLQYDYLRGTIRKKYRRAKWLKPEQIENLKLIQKYFGYNIVRAKEAMKLLNQEQIEQIRGFLDPGGTK